MDIRDPEYRGMVELSLDRKDEILVLQEQIRKLQAKEVIEHPDVQRLVKQAVLDGFKIKELQAENDGLKKQARCPCGEELEGLGYGQDGSVIYECNKCKSQINISKEAWQARKGNPNGTS